MSTISQIACDRCRKIVSFDEGASWLSLQLGIGTRIEVEVCPSCVPAFAEFLPGVDRELLSRFVTYPESFTLNSEGERVLPKAVVQVTERLQMPFRAEQIVIEERPFDWVVNDIRIGNRHQFAQSGDVPGDLFGPDAVVGALSFETAQRGQPFVIIATYIGKNPEGAAFKCTVHGVAFGFPPKDEPAGA